MGDWPGQIFFIKEQDVNASIYIKGFPSSWDEGDLRSTFLEYGEIISVRLLRTYTGFFFFWTDSVIFCNKTCEHIFYLVGTQSQMPYFHDYIPVPSISQVTANLAAKQPFPRRESHDELLCYGLSGEKNSAYNHTFEYCSDESQLSYLQNRLYLKRGGVVGSPLDN